MYGRALRSVRLKKPNKRPGGPTAPPAGTDDASYRYVQQGAAGSGTGLDWTNAFTALPATLTRGNTYWIADSGAYASYVFDDAVSGSTPITIKKATVADHGTSTGWADAYGDGQAVFGDFAFTTSNWVIDGQTRNESDWFAGASYGFSIGSDTSQNQISIQNYGAAPDNITIKYAYVPGWSAAMPGTTQRIYAIDTDDFDGGTTCTGLVFHRMFVSNSNNIWFLRTTSGAIVEYCASSGVKSNGANHGEIVNLYYSGNNAIIRYNKWRNAFLDSGGTALVAITAADGMEFYGNVCWNFNVGDGALGFDGQSTSNNLVYNNTFVDSIGFNAGCRWGTGTNNVVRNNLWINCGAVDVQGTASHNGYSAASGDGTNAQLNIPTSIFVSYAGADYRLASATTAGTTLAAPYDTDLLGVVRGNDGTWDRGAYEYSP